MLVANFVDVKEVLKILALVRLKETNLSCVIVLVNSKLYYFFISSLYDLTRSLVFRRRKLHKRI